MFEQERFDRVCHLARGRIEEGSSAMRQQLEVAIRHSLAAQARNRLAWVLLVAFVPGWYLLIGSMIRTPGGAFVLRSTGTRWWWTATTSP